MAKVHITNVVVLNNPSNFFNPFQFELTLECIEELKEDLEWKMIYVGSAESEAHDQILDTIYVGPVTEGRHVFVFQADPPDVTRIPGKLCILKSFFVNFDMLIKMLESAATLFSSNNRSYSYLMFRTRCCRCNDCIADVLIPWPRICSCRLLHK